MIAGRYRLEKEIGRGGAGVVHLAYDELLDRRVAVKRIGLLPGTTDDDVVRAQREARLAAGTNHPHVVSIFDLVKDEDCFWLVMEHVDGRTLAELIAAEGPLPDTTCGRDPRPGRRRPRPGRHRGGRPPRRQAQQHHPQRRRPREARGLRHRPVGERHCADPDRAHHGLPRLPRTRGGVRGAGERGERRVVPRRDAVPRRRRHVRRTTWGPTSSAASTRSSTTTRRGCPPATPRRDCWP